MGLVYVGAAKVVVTNNTKDRTGHDIAFEFETLDYNSWTQISDRLDEEKYTILRSANLRHFKPSVITLSRFNRTPKYEIKFCRTSLYERDKGICQYCGVKLTKSSATIDHINPKSKGGKNTWDNTVLSCKPCNDKKSDKLLEEIGMTLLSIPKKPTWISVKFGKARTIKERDEWKKFVNYV